MVQTTMQPWYKALAAWIEKRGGAREIWRNENGEHVLYLKRYYILKTPWREVFIHQFFRGDVGPLHDHPASSFGRILEGGYWEHLCSLNTTGSGWSHINTWKEWRSPGFFKWAKRPASSQNHNDLKSFHKVELLPEDIGKGNVWTLFSLGKRNEHSWGFLTEKGYVPFQDQMKSEGTNEKQASHTEYKGWLFPTRKK